MAKKDGELTPLMKQYWDIKSLHQDKILLFRMGDFYELFYDDAVKASPLLGITLTQRNKKSEDQTPMCGFPHHAVAGPINKLLAAGYKVAICDQVEDPATAKGIVKRAITRILTPGMVYDSETLDHSKAHYLTAIDGEKISFVDTTTGESFYFRSIDLTEKVRLLDVLPVAELVVESKTEKWLNDVKLPERVVISECHPAESTERLLSYIKSLANAELLQTLRPFTERELEHRLQLSQTTLRHLEVFSSFKGDAQGSLYQAINRTKTSSGARLLRQWLCFPLRNQKQIEFRYDQLESFRNQMLELKKVREALGGMGDIERRLTKIAQPQCNGRDLTALADSVTAGLSALGWCENFFKSSSSRSYLTEALEVANRIQERISEEAPLSVKQGHIIKPGFSSELDELVNLSTNATSLIEELERREKDRTGISSLKVRYNNVFGYYIEITHLHRDKVPADYQRKQTLANAERYCTEELIELEKKVLSAQVKRFELEFSLFDQLRRHVLEKASALLGLAQLCSELDVVSSLAWLSLEQSYCRPEITSKRELKLENCRHPVVEQFTGSSFVPNTVSLGTSECLLLTGPNMAGKSTLMRQVALNVLLAQMGSYVPALSASLPVYDAIFTRIGASDQLSEGLSTFMVEMTETAHMLKSATPNSLLILDEVGRGTATFDGMCLAQAILEYILEHHKNHMFFATHYHELTALQNVSPQIKNAHMKVLDHGNGRIEFLHVLMPGPAGKSYGVQVAELAGVPAEVTRRAEQLLKLHEGQAPRTSQTHAATENLTQLEPAKVLPVVTNQMSLFERDEELKKQKLIEDVKKFSVQKSSPLQALNKIAEWQDNLN
jgi:DNA mismatch repair protein MutS